MRVVVFGGVCLQCTLSEGGEQTDTTSNISTTVAVGGMVQHEFQTERSARVQHGPTRDTVRDST